MTMPIPSGVPLNSVLDFQHNSLVSPPVPPAVVEALKAIDPRIALNMPQPVVDAAASSALRDALQNNVNLMNVDLQEPNIDRAVLLEIAGNQNMDPASQGQSNKILADSLSKMDSLASSALGQLLSSVLEADTTSTRTTSKSAVVLWPSNINPNSPISLENSPAQIKMAMGALYQNLQSSGIFAANQLKKLLLPASEDASEPNSQGVSQADQAAQLLQQLTPSSQSVQDSVKLLLRGNMAWEGRLVPNLQARFYREDAWQTDSRDPNQLMKGSRISLEVDLPNLGKLKVTGTQFGEALNVTIQVNSSAQAVLVTQFDALCLQVHEHIDAQAQLHLQ